MSKRILVTGAAGFIGFHLSRRLLKDGHDVIGVDNLDDFYEVSLKKDRLAILHDWSNFRFHRIDLVDRKNMKSMFVDKDLNTDDYIVNLAAQASVFYGQLHPEKYIHSNVVGFHNLLELARSISCKHLIYASTSSVYGGNTNRPYSVHDNVDHPVSLYAATKKSNELLSHVYSYTYGLPTTGLRFFTVYGPWGRPDMAYYLFTRAILAGEPITVYNHGDMSRDFTYIDDIIEAIVRLLDHIPELDVSWDRDNPDPATSWIPYRIFNIGNQHSINLLDFVHVIEDALGKKADIDLQPMRTGDVKDTFANIDSLNAAIGFKPSTPIQEGIGKFVEWYLDYYKVKL